MNRHEKIIKQLTTIAIDTQHPTNYKLIAGIVYRGDIVSIGINNLNKTHPLQVKHGRNPKGIYLHAEIDAIAKAYKRLSSKEMMKSSIYVVRVRKFNGEWARGCARPCELICQPTIEAFNIGKVFWTEDEEWI